jgi:hypothetical protein
MNRLISRLAFLAGLAAALLIGGAGPLYRFAGIELSQAFGFMTWGVYAAGGALALSVLWIILAAIGRTGEGLGSGCPRGHSGRWQCAGAGAHASDGGEPAGDP